MSDGQYRALVAYLNFWSTSRFSEFSFDFALQDIGITDTKEQVLYELFKCGWVWDDDLMVITYDA